MPWHSQSTMDATDDPDFKRGDATGHDVGKAYGSRRAHSPVIQALARSMQRDARALARALGFNPDDVAVLTAALLCPVIDVLEEAADATEVSFDEVRRG